MRTAVVVLSLLTCGWGASAQRASTEAPEPVRAVQDALNSLRERRAAARERALEALAHGDALEAYLAIDDALLMTGSDEELAAAWREAHAGAVGLALRTAAAYEAEGRSDRALDLLLRLRDGGADARLDEAILRARVGRALDHAAALEARVELEDAQRVALLAANISPDDPRTAAALTRLRAAVGAHPIDNPHADPAPVDDPAAGVPPPASLAPPANVASEQIARMALERRVDRLDDALGRALAQIERLGGDTTLRPGAPQPAVVELDRRINDNERNMSRLVNEIRREVDRLSRDVQSLRREVDRLR